ncbi:MAG: hypothetical protein IPO62_13265 [Saprospiraceae bacterium]|nr:hypothetical protein [Saprospiraceae bacterium]
MLRNLYVNLFEKSISNNLFDSILSNTIHRDDENIFICWGLPESFIYRSREPDPKKYIASQIGLNYSKWKNWLDGGIKSKNKRSVQELIDWSVKLITKYFHK